jgi:hypothetical protein
VADIPQWPYIDNFYLPIACHVCNETFDATSDVNVPCWICGFDKPGHQQILMEIVPARCSRQLSKIIEDRIRIGYYATSPLKRAPISHISTEITGSYEKEL